MVRGGGSNKQEKGKGREREEERSGSHYRGDSPHGHHGGIAADIGDVSTRVPLRLPRELLDVEVFAQLDALGKQFERRRDKSLIATCRLISKRAGRASSSGRGM